MTEVTYIPWKPPAETDLPHIEALWNDVWDARMRAVELHQILSAPPDQRRLQLEPLVIAALIKYFRAFSTGRRRQKLRLDDAPSLPATLRAAHEHLKAVRDRHVAHPVNRYEAHHITLAVAGLGMPQANATAVSTSSTSFHGLSLLEVSQLIELCDYWLERLGKQKADASAFLMQIAQTLTPDQLNRLPRSYSDGLDENPFLNRR